MSRLQGLSRNIRDAAQEIEASKIYKINQLPSIFNENDLNEDRREYLAKKEGEMIAKGSLKKPRQSTEYRDLLDKMKADYQRELFDKLVDEVGVDIFLSLAYWHGAIVAEFIKVATIKDEL